MISMFMWNMVFKMKNKYMDKKGWLIWKIECNNKKYTFEQLLEERGYIVYTNEGYSMMPLLRQHKDIIEIRKKGHERCKKYDVVLYKRGDKYILHRILKVLSDRYIIAGDHNTFLEKDITDDCILGVMTRIVRDGKSIYIDNKVYMLYVHLWCDLYPVRMFILRNKFRIRKALSKVKKAVISKARNH